MSKMQKSNFNQEEIQLYASTIESLEESKANNPNISIKGNQISKEDKHFIKFESINATNNHKIFSTQQQNEEQKGKNQKETKQMNISELIHKNDMEEQLEREKSIENPSSNNDIQIQNQKKQISQLFSQINKSRSSNLIENKIKSNLKSDKSIGYEKYRKGFEAFSQGTIEMAKIHNKAKKIKKIDFQDIDNNQFCDCCGLPI